MLSLPLHIICIQSPYDMYPSMIVRENSHSHVKRARSQQHWYRSISVALVDLYLNCNKIIHDIHARYASYQLMPPQESMHIVLNSAYVSSSVCMVYHSISVSTRNQHDPRSSYTSVSSCLMILTLLRASISICSHDMRIYSLWVHWCITRRLQPRQHTYIHHIKWHWYVLCSVKAFVCACDE